MTGNEILARARRREQMAAPAAVLRPDNDHGEERQPDGFIIVDDEFVPVWLPAGETAESLGLKTFTEGAHG